MILFSILYVAMIIVTFICFVLYDIYLEDSEVIQGMVTMNVLISIAWPLGLPVLLILLIGNIAHNFISKKRKRWKR